MKDTLNITVYYTINIKLTSLFNIAIQLGSLILQKSTYLLFRISCLTEHHWSLQQAGSSHGTLCMLFLFLVILWRLGVSTIASKGFDWVGWVTAFWFFFFILGIFGESGLSGVCGGLGESVGCVNQLESKGNAGPVSSLMNFLSTSWSGCRAWIKLLASVRYALGSSKSIYISS